MAWFHRFMRGRNGVDRLTYALCILYWPFYLLVRLTNYRVFDFLGLLCLFTAIFRVLSRNLPRRQMENRRYLQIEHTAVRKVKLNLRRIKEIRTNRFYECPGCKLTLRVPAGKGAITIRCPRCKTTISKRT